MDNSKSKFPMSVIIHTRNSEATLARTLESVAWADERIVVDMKSTDTTREIARQHGAHLIDAPPSPRVDGVRNQYLQRANHDWILVLDSDEVLADGAENAVRRVLNKWGEAFVAFAVPRRNRIAGQLMRGSGWVPDLQIRLFRRGAVHWQDGVHIPPRVSGGNRKLKELRPEDGLLIHHWNYDNLRHFLQKQLDYALAEEYSTDPEEFDFSDYVANAYEKLALRDDPETDGDLSHALALALAWNEINRGLLHWDSLTPRPPLRYLSVLPVATERIPRWRIRLRRWLGRHQPLAYYLRRIRDILGIPPRRGR